MNRSERVTPVAAAVSAMATLACCLPVGLATAAATASLGVLTETLRPWLLALSVVLLGVGMYHVYGANVAAFIPAFHIPLSSWGAASERYRTSSRPLEQANFIQDNKQNLIFESACYEGNYSLTSMLAGARRLERERMAKRK